MKIKVIKAYRDKDTLIVHGIGDIVEYPLERANFIISLGFAEAVEEKAEEVKEEKKAPTKTKSKSRGAVK